MEIIKQYNMLYHELKYGRWKHYVRPMIGKNFKNEKLDYKKINLIKDIEKIYYHNDDPQPFAKFHNDDAENEYVIYFRLKKGIYGYLRAWHDYTGFDCRGGIEIYLSKHQDRIEKYAIPKKYFDIIKKSSIFRESYIK